MLQSTLPDSPPMTVIIITRNEEHNIEACLKSLGDFDEIVVVDNGSTDKTCDIIAGFANARLLRSAWLGYGGTRQVAVNAASHDWIVWLDADERMTPELADEIRTALKQAQPRDVLSMPRRNFFLGRQIRGCGWSPDRVQRVFHKAYCRFDDKIVHEGLSSRGPVRVHLLGSALQHFSYRNLRQFFDKNIHYAELAGAERRRSGRRVFAAELFLRPWWEFFRCYVLKRGFADGLRGLVICFGSAIYVFSRDAYVLLEKE